MLSNLMSGGGLTLQSLLWRTHNRRAQPTPSMYLPQQRTDASISATGALTLQPHGSAPMARNPAKAFRRGAHSFLVGEFVRVVDYPHADPDTVFEVARRTRYPGWEGQAPYDSYLLESGLHEIITTQPERLVRTGYVISLSAADLQKLVSGESVKVGTKGRTIVGELQLAAADERQRLSVFLDQLLERGAIT